MKLPLGAGPNVPNIYHTTVHSILVELCQDPCQSTAKKGPPSLFFSLCTALGMTAVKCRFLLQSPGTQQHPLLALRLFPANFASKSKEHRFLFGKVHRLYIFASMQAGKVKLGRPPLLGQLSSLSLTFCAGQPRWEVGPLLALGREELGSYSVCGLMEGGWELPGVARGWAGAAP